MPCALRGRHARQASIRPLETRCSTSSVSWTPVRFSKSMPRGRQWGAVGYEHILELTETENDIFHRKRERKDGAWGRYVDRRRSPIGEHYVSCVISPNQCTYTWYKAIQTESDLSLFCESQLDTGSPLAPLPPLHRCRGPGHAAGYYI